MYFALYMDVKNGADGNVVMHGILQKNFRCVMQALKIHINLMNK